MGNTTDTNTDNTDNTDTGNGGTKDDDRNHECLGQDRSVPGLGGRDGADHNLTCRRPLTLWLNPLPFILLLCVSLFFSGMILIYALTYIRMYLFVCLWVCEAYGMEYFIYYKETLT